MADKYSNYAELAAAEEEGIDFEVVVVKREPPRVAVIAPHAGGIEPRTGPIAREIAGAEFSLYCFRGMKNPSNQDLHITSHHFDEPMCLDLIKDHEWVVAIHGCQKKGEHVFLSGLDKALIADLEANLLQTAIRVQTLGHKYTGTLRQNICNRGRSHAGVQFELSRSFRNGDRVGAFIEAVRVVLFGSSESRWMKSEKLNPFEEILQPEVRPKSGRR
jgi:phage replication-related protein YjqB (UPF0714/DUF867 family)